MFSNPLTPPNESSGPALFTDDTITFPLGPSYSPQQHASPATPTSNIGMGSDDVGDSGTDDRADPSALTDADQDMSDGGVPLAMSLSHTPNFNPEVDMLDVEAMDVDDLEMIPHISDYPSSNMDELPFSHMGYNTSFDQSGDGEEQEAEMGGVFDGPAVSTLQSAPMPLLVMDQPLNPEDWQPHVDAEIPADDAHLEYVQHNSTQPIPLPPSLSETLILLATSPAPAVFQALAQALPPIQVAPGVFQFSFSDPPHSSTSSQSPDANVTGWHSGHDPDSVNNSVVIPNQAITISGIADADEVEDQFNLSLGDFLYNWAVSPSEGEDSKRRLRRPRLSAIHDQRFLGELVSPVKRSDLRGDKCDIQGLDWVELGVSRAAARTMRHQTYKNYTSLRPTAQWHPRINGMRLRHPEDFFSFRRMDFGHKIHLAHFQLRNLLACPSLDRVFYAGRSHVRKWDARNGHVRPKTVMDLTHPEHQSYHAFAGGVQISTLAASNDILVAGGFCGEYGLINLRSNESAPHTEGLLSESPNNITNHIQVQLNRRSGLPEAVFASNDNAVRILDCNTNSFVAEHFYGQAINCSAVSPDKRLRVLVGDTRDVLICNAETGEVFHKLEGHRDFGFACDWADDGWTVATGNQDMQVKIWDARKWTDSRGLASPVTTISAELAGVRKLKFSPLGSGKRVLVAAEPADIISVIDADTFYTKQTLEFFGEIGGLDFTRDGNDIVVANCDHMRGGIMQFERCGWADEGLYALRQRDEGNARGRRGGNGFDWRRTVEEVVGDEKIVGTRLGRERRAAAVGVNMGAF